MLRYANDTVLLSDNMKGLQEMLNAIEQVLESYRMKISNNKKTKIIVERRGKDQTKIGIKVQDQLL